MWFGGGGGGRHHRLSTVASSLLEQGADTNEPSNQAGSQARQPSGSRNEKRVDIHFNYCQCGAAHNGTYVDFRYKNRSNHYIGRNNMSYYESSTERPPQTQTHRFKSIR